MDLSVIIPCYNCEETLGEQLEALSTQIWDKPWEVIVADNGSTDKTADIVRAFQKKMPNLKLVDASATKGRAFARNTGVGAALGDKLAFVDGDDVVAEGWVEAIGNALEHHNFVASRHDFAKLNPPAVLATRKNAQDKGLQAYTYPPFMPHAGGCGLGIKRAVHLEMGGFNNQLVRLQDTDYCWRAQLAGYDLVFVPEATVHVRFQSEAKHIYRQARENGEANVLLYKLYRPKGMPPLDWKEGTFAWYKLVKTLPHLLNAQKRDRWLWQFGWRYGRLMGSLKHNIFAL